MNRGATEAVSRTSSEISVLCRLTGGTTKKLGCQGNNRGPQHVMVREDRRMAWRLGEVRRLGAWVGVLLGEVRVSDRWRPPGC